MNKEDLINKKYKEATDNLAKSSFEPSTSKWYEQIIRLPEALQVTYMTVILNNQIINGGFDQYFINGYGQFAPETVKFLKSLKATQKSEVLHKAFLLVNTKGYSLKDYRHLLLNKKISSLFDSEDLQIRLSLLDHEFDNNDEDLIDLLGDYLAKQ